MDTVKISRATEADAQEILKLQKEAYASEADIYKDPNIQPMVMTIEQTREEIQKQLVLKAVLGGAIIGSVRGYERGGTCMIGKLMVCPQMQGRGLGKRLLRSIEHSFPGARRFELFTGYKSERNLYLYKKAGYVQFEVPGAPEKQLVFLEKTKSIKNPAFRALLIVLGLLCTGLGFLGIFLPGLPATPFLLLAAALFARSSERFYEWLIYNRLFGRYIRGYLEKRGIPLRIKIYAITMLWLTILPTIIFLVPVLAVRILLAAVAAAVTWHIAAFKTAR